MGVNAGAGSGPVSVAARNENGQDLSPDTRAFTVDVIPPDTLITKLTIRSAKRKATVAFNGTDSNPPSLPLLFTCKIDGKPYASCRSPKTYRHLKVGKHRLRVKARDAAGNVDSSSAVKRFKIGR